ncbi:hypothetical protein E4U21_001927 [Claviceps maximensis]|nr:hypothetical protein E4U21_001927 [Claviceps maximensis]
MAQASNNYSNSSGESSLNVDGIQIGDGTASETSFVTDIDEKANKRLLRKIDWKLMPVLSATYALQFYGKAVLGQAIIFGLGQDLRLQDGLKFSWVILIFYFGYILGTYPISLVAQRYSPRTVITIVFFLWATVIISSTAFTSYRGILINRFFLGFVGSGVSPIFMLVVGL